MGPRDRYTPVAGLHYSIVVGVRSSRTDNNNRADTSKDNPSPSPSPNQETRSRPRRACYRGHDDGYCGGAHCGPRQLDLRESRRWEHREEPPFGAPRKSPLGAPRRAPFGAPRKPPMGAPRKAPDGAPRIPPNPPPPRKPPPRCALAEAVNRSSPPPATMRPVLIFILIPPLPVGYAVNYKSERAADAPQAKKHLRQISDQQNSMAWSRSCQ